MLEMTAQLGLARALNRAGDSGTLLMLRLGNKN